MQSKLLPHMRPVFEKYRLEERTRETERREREDSEQRVLQASLRDSERILKLREERLRKEREAENESLIVENQRREEQRRRLKTASRHAYWKRAAESIPESSSANTRITIRLPDGRRTVRQFSDAQAIRALYCFAASELATSLPTHQDEESLPPYDPNEDGWGFTLATSYPRVPIPWSPSPESSISSVAEGALKNGALLVVEMENGELSESRSVAGANATTDDDDYLSE